jgi:hypothetical protein
MKMEDITNMFGFSVAQISSWQEGHAIKNNPKLSKKLQFLIKVLKTLPKSKVEKILQRDTINLSYKDIEKTFGIIYTKIYRWNKKYEKEILNKKIDKRGEKNSKRNFNIEKKLRLIEFLQKLEPEEIECLKNILYDEEN